MNMKRKILGFDSFEWFPQDFYNKTGQEKPKLEFSKNEQINNIEKMFQNAKKNSKILQKITIF